MARRLETVRSYFIERFFAALISEPDFATLRHPSELFDKAGNFVVLPNPAGFIQLPSLANLETRIAGATGVELDDLNRFRDAMVRAFDQITGGFGNVPVRAIRDLAMRLAPIIRHPDGQNFLPVAMDKLLNYEDSVLAARMYSNTGQTRLRGRIFDLLFENLDTTAALPEPAKPYSSRIPFVATIGVDPSVPGFPATPLSLGHLNLSAADARLAPGIIPPTLYAEVKSIAGALAVNTAYGQAARGLGRFSELRGNRLHTDPLLTNFPGDSPETGQTKPEATPTMVVYHAFYPADDEGRRHPKLGATNREFHHLAAGLLVPPTSSRTATVALLQRTYVFTCEGPDFVRMLPLSHPALERRNDRGELDPEGDHVVLYCTLASPSGWRYSDEPSDANRSIIQDSVAKDAPWTGRLLGGLTVVALGAGIGAVGGPIGAAIGAAIALIVYVLVSLFCWLFGCGGGDNTQFQQHPAFDPPSSTSSFTSPELNDIGPPGATKATGGGKPARTFELRTIPHAVDHNLYGLQSTDADRLHIDDDPATQEMLAWHSFPGGIGYQFHREVPGNSDIAGSSMRNYFTLFLEKAVEVFEAQGLVSYFA